jgi:hypothetical protein
MRSSLGPAAVAAFLLAIAACKGERGAGGAGVDAGAGGALGSDTGAGAGAGARATPAVEPPTADECERALANLIKVIPDGVIGDSRDMGFCMAMPRPVVRCLVDVKTEDEADRCMTGFVGSIPPLVARAAGDDPPASAEDCRLGIENVRRLVPEMTAGIDVMVTQCAGSEPRSYTRCLAAAKSTEDLDRCEREE